MKLPSTFFILSILILLSCSKEVKIYFPSQYVKDNKVIINNEHNLADHVTNNSRFSHISIQNGDFEIDIDGDKKQLNTENGGLINFDKEEFVIFSVLYNFGNKETQDHIIIMTFPIILDSLVIYSMSSVGKKDMYIQIAKNGINQKYDPLNAKKRDLIKINKNDFFIEKIWDYNINDNIEDHVEVKVGQDVTHMEVRKKAFVPADFFYFYAKESGQYNIIDLRDLK